jgi:hypothetical protein
MMLRVCVAATIVLGFTWIFPVGTRYSFSLVAAGCCVLLLAGFWCFPFVNRGIVFIVPSGDSSSVDIPMLMGGMTVSRQSYDQRILCTLRLSHMRELLAASLLFIFSSNFVLMVQSSNGSTECHRVVYTILVAVIGWVSIASNLIWFWECRLLRNSRAVIGAVRTVEMGRIWAKLVYEFPDQEGHQRIGRIKVMKRSQDNGVIVFHDRRDPEKNIPHRCLIFHSIVCKVG